LKVALPLPVMLPLASDAIVFAWLPLTWLRRLLAFDEAERAPSDDLALQFEAVSNMPDEERRIIKALLDGMIIKYQTKQMTGNLSS
jgi:hypothetical protein